MPADNALSFTLKKAGYTSVVLTGTRGVFYGTSNATITLTNGSETVTYTATMEEGINSKDYEITGLTPESTYSITYSGNYASGSVSSVTTLTDEPRAAMLSQWEDLADRIKAKADASSVSEKLDNATNFWGQTATNNIVSGNIDLGTATTNNPRTISVNGGDAQVVFGHSAPDNGEDFVTIKATNASTSKSASLLVMADNEAYIVSNAPLHMGSKQIKNLADGTASTDAVTKGQMDTAVGNVETILQTLNSGTGAQEES